MTFKCVVQVLNDQNLQSESDYKLHPQASGEQYKHSAEKLLQRVKLIARTFDIYGIKRISFAYTVTQVTVT